MSEPIIDDTGLESAVKEEKEESAAPDIDMSVVSASVPLVPVSISRESSEPVAAAVNSEREVSPKRELQIDHDRVDAVAMIGGSTTRRYLNEHVTKHLLEGMKLIAREQPQDPLRVLGEFLLNASKISEEPSA
ncbi:unnamed protein product [Kluyveromyces dobzhanskii CBS 2104]|uniref:WGS project CCBQ000000000 data, contig 00106 n=1 Tax=Kluyveromyces dobzhanskii CBS 2104 TaxID=1427455 RepID=A0A0A8L5Z0_9SACH|nr:unnamed protein product [Kluyveromyces dobzhanskii CBS 2104]